MKEVENESIKTYRSRLQQKSFANAVADVCLSDINIKASEAIQEIDGILRSCYMTGKSVEPEHDWYSDKTVEVTSTTQTSTSKQTTTTQPPSTTSSAATDKSTPSFPATIPSNTSDSLVLPIKEIEPVVNQVAGKIRQNVDGWFTSAKNKVMSLIR